MKTISERIYSLRRERVHNPSAVDSLPTLREPNFLAAPAMGNLESSFFLEVGPEEELRAPFGGCWRHILVPITLEEASIAALEFASVLARRFGSELTLLYNYQLAASAGTLRIEAELWRHFSRIRTRHPIVRLFLHSGLSYDQVMATAKRTSADLIVMSSDYYRQFLSYVVQGESARSLVQIFPCPVVLVKSSVSGRDSSPRSAAAA